jgi:hypothetical protein
MAGWFFKPRGAGFARSAPREPQARESSPAVFLRSFDGRFLSLVAKIGIGELAAVVENHCEFLAVDGWQVEREWPIVRAAVALLTAPETIGNF